ncbi:MAG: hypothetical protein AW09_002117 [Candidatus Accumulibacter phosphatis]|uniref:Uncharacterized protein n=1 Tax=Candidatus Accumulibacter phosphatis TaxID=327160 RepID=A0A080M6F6_9PROT|nr:MAG: hypothetical protein AW09_002117 [Candidatus Accumulibacter phosphatis]
MRVGFRLRAFERPFRGFEIVQLRFLDIVDQCPHHLAHQRVVEVVALVFERAFEFLQAVAAEIVGDAESTRLRTPFKLQILKPAEEIAGFRYLARRELGKQDVPLFADRNRLVRCHLGSFHFLHSARPV